MTDFPTPKASFRRASSRDGVVLVAALVCLLVTISVAGGLLQSITIQQRHSRDDETNVQALWIAESAKARAAAQLAGDAAYAGETWRVSLGQQEGVAEIRVETPDGQPQQRRITVEARWPEDALRRRVLKRNLIIQLPRSGDTP
jgi:type II secretory pathway component PulK